MMSSGPVRWSRVLRQNFGFVLWIADLLVSAACAGAVDSIQVLKQDDVYRVKINALIHVPPDVSPNLLTDYGNLTRISPAFLENKVLSVRNHRIYRVYIITRL